MPEVARRIESPYEVEARYATKRSMSWVGYKVHLTVTSLRRAKVDVSAAEASQAGTGAFSTVGVGRVRMAGATTYRYERRSSSEEPRDQRSVAALQLAAAAFTDN